MSDDEDIYPRLDSLWAGDWSDLVDLDELERLLAAATGHHALRSMGELDALIKAERAFHTYARETLPTLIATARRVEVLERENARLRAGLTSINRKASPDPERTMSEASNDLYWCACEARAALGEPQ